MYFCVSSCSDHLGSRAEYSVAFCVLTKKCSNTVQLINTQTVTSVVSSLGSIDMDTEGQRNQGLTTSTHSSFSRMRHTLNINIMSECTYQITTLNSAYYVVTIQEILYVH